jgi:two-component system, sensor histidine kinase and response regulator
MMPEMSGYEFFLEFQNQYSSYDIPFIFLTAKSNDSDVRIGMNLGIDDYIKKPFKTSDLIRSIELRLGKNKKVKEKFDLFTQTLAYNIPHELRTPLVPIIGFSELILERGDQFTEDEINSFMTAIKSSGTRLKERIEKLLVYEKLELQDIINMRLPHNGPNIEVDFDQLKDSLIEVSLKMNRNKNISIVIHPAKLVIYFPHLVILLNELLENAIKHSLPDTVIEVIGRIEKNQYIFSIKDNGNRILENEIDIPSEAMDESNEYWNHTGFGLSIVKKILNRYNSNLHIIRNKEGGITTNFSIGLKRNYCKNSSLIDVSK